MEPRSSGVVYVIDTSSFINLQPMRRRTFGVLWNRMDALAEAGRLLVPEEVQRELGDDIAEEPVAWLRTHGGIVIPTKTLWDRAREVAERYRDQGLVDLAKPSGTADPYLIALGLYERERQQGMLWESQVVLVTQERRRRPGRVAIPDACDDYGLDVTNLQGLFDSEDWDDL